MRPTRLLVPLAATVAMLAVPSIAHAATISQPFAADSGDSCRYGSTSGTLTWQNGVVSPLPFPGVGVKGQVSDRPLPVESGLACRDDGFNSTATFTAYAGDVVVDQQSRSANNATVTFSFNLGVNSKASSIDHVVVQVCRSPIVTLPPSYCGKPVTYVAPPTA
jgi:hypothetical protein